MSLLRKLSNGQRCCMLVSLVTVLASLALTIAFSPMLYLTNDDTSIQGALAGNNTGAPYPVHRFIGALASFFVSGLYRIAPSIQWWYVYSLALMLTGMFLIHYAILTLMTNRKGGMALGIVLSLLLDLCVMVFPLSRVSFTIVPAVLCAGIIAWYLASPRPESPVVRITCVALYVLAISHRDASAMASLAFFALGALVVSYEEHGLGKSFVTSLIPLAVALIAVTLTLSNGNKAFQNAWNGPEFQAYNHARVRYKDYPHDSYQDNPHIYEHVNWDSTLYTLVDNWCFMDERVTTEAFAYLSEHSMAQAPTASRPSPKEALNGIQDNVTQAKVCLAAWGMVSLLTLAYLLISRQALATVVHLASSLACVGLLAFQYLQGRLLYRSMLVVILPAIITSLMLALRANRSGKGKTTQLVTIALLCLCLAPLVAKSLSNAFDANERTRLENISNASRDLNDYVIAHKPTVYVQTVAVSDCIDPRMIYPHDKPSNLFLWGGSQFGSKLFAARLACNSLDSLSGSVFRDEDALFVTNQSIAADPRAIMEDDLLWYVIKWQMERYGAIGIEQVDTVCDNVYVYRFVYTEEPDATYYTIDDGGLRLVETRE